MVEKINLHGFQPFNGVWLPAKSTLILGRVKQKRTPEQRAPRIEKCEMEYAIFQSGIDFVLEIAFERVIRWPYLPISNSTSASDSSDPFQGFSSPERESPRRARVLF